MSQDKMLHGWGRRRQEEFGPEGQNSPHAQVHPQMPGSAASPCPVPSNCITVKTTMARTAGALLLVVVVALAGVADAADAAVNE
jgi:hypothetical protein